MDPFDIYWVHHPWNNSDYPRPWLIIDFGTKNLVGCFPIATECYCGNCFFIPQSHPDFAATGLDHSSHVHDSHLIDIPGNQFVEKKGQIEGRLLAEFRAASGV